MRKQREADVLAQCLAWLRLKGAFCWRQNQGAISGEHKGKRRFLRFASMPGISDIVGLAPGGRLLAVETKRPGRGPTAAQEAFLADVRDRGGFGVCVHSLAELEVAAELEGVFDR